MMDIYIEINIPDEFEDDPIAHREKVHSDLKAIGWPDAHSAGTCFAYEVLVCDLQFEFDDTDKIARGVALVRETYDVRKISIDALIDEAEVEA